MDIRQACKQMKRWHTLGYSHLKIGVNLSAKEFEQEDFVKSISSYFNKYRFTSKLS